MAKLGGRGPQKLAPHRGIEEQVPDLNAGSRGAVPGANGGQLAALAADLGAGRLVVRPGLERDLGHAPDRRQGFTTKAEGIDPKQVLRAGQLAGGMAGQGQG